ncbi:hypothetical protein [Marinicrinis lubricantis]|uniref:Two-component sensor histidine kinase n=1 Tax=Marinicrinis lubricantis TaxID=2086470 RepID=A0ABW1IKH1_9BACL
MMKKAIPWIRQGSLRNKLFSASMICLLIPTLITLSATHVWTRDEMREQAESNADEQLKLVEGHVSNLLSYMLHISNYIIVEPNMNTILKQQAAGKTYTGENSEYREFEDRNEITSQIDNISIIGEKTYVTILLPNGRHFTNYPIDEYDPSQMLELPWFKELDQLTGMVKPIGLNQNRLPSSMKRRQDEIKSAWRER